MCGAQTAIAGESRTIKPVLVLMDYPIIVLNGVSLVALDKKSSGSHETLGLADANSLR